MDETKNTVKNIIKMKPKVLVLMSTYNGEKFLCQQLDSLYNQSGVDIHILVRDDGSYDSTLNILRKYQSMNPRTMTIEEGNNIGCVESFFWLMREATQKFSDFDCYAFSDQDDVWLKDKLFSGVDSITKSNRKYKLYFCSSQLVDTNLSPLPTKYISFRLSLAEAFVFQPCIGCTMIFNYALLAEAAKGDTSIIDIHDAWMYKLALSLRAQVIYDPKPRILYRQHSSNTIGSHQSFFSIWERRFRWFYLNKKYRSTIARHILEDFSDNIPYEEKLLLTDLSKYKISFKSKFNLLTSSSFNTSKKLHSFLFRIAVLTNRI